MLGREPLFPPTWRRPVVHIPGAMSNQLLDSCLRIWQLSDMSWDVISPWELIFVAGVYGVYAPLFAAALWTSWQESTTASKAMRAVCTLMFCVVTVQFALTAVAGFFSCDSGADWKYLTAARRLLGAAIFISSLLSDGVLAWRCYILYGGRRWVLMLLIIALVLIGGSGFLMAYASVRKGIWATPEEPNDMWSPAYLSVNSVLTASIAARIIYFHQKTTFTSSRSLLVAAGRAVVESAFVSWIAVFLGILFAQATFSADANFQRWSRFYALSDGLSLAMPTIFGISQTLIITRVALSRFSKSPSFATTLHALTTDVDCVADPSSSTP